MLSRVINNLKEMKTIEQIQQRINEHKHVIKTFKRLGGANGKYNKSIELMERVINELKWVTEEDQVLPRVKN